MIPDHGGKVSNGGEIAYQSEGLTIEDAVGTLGGEGADALDDGLGTAVVDGIGNDGAEAGDGVESVEHGADAFIGVWDG